jgi:GNAT superfamily N-acetyltransferase
MGINFVKFNPSHNAELLAQLVECFRNVFAGPPWNEFLKCPNCNGYWGTKHLGVLASEGYRHCNLELVDFWPRTTVLQDIYHEVTGESSCWLAMYGDKVIGFAWGYPMQINALSEKLKLTLNTSSFALDATSTVIYQDEVGVVPEFRGQGIAKELVKRRNQDLCNRDTKIGVVRTRKDPEPSITYIWYERLGYQIIGEYPAGDGRVIMASNVETLFSS